MIGVSVFNAWAFRADGALEASESSNRQRVTPELTIAFCGQQMQTQALTHLIEATGSTDQHSDETQDEASVDNLLLGPELQGKVVWHGCVWTWSRRWEEEESRELRNERQLAEVVLVRDIETQEAANDNQSILYDDATFNSAFS